MATPESFVVPVIAAADSVAISIPMMAADLISQSDYRSILPDGLEENCGDFIVPFGTVTAIGALGKMVEIQGLRTSSKLLQNIGFGIQFSSVPIGLALILGVEGQWVRNINLLIENIPDAANGALAVGLSGLFILCVNRIIDLSLQTPSLSQYE